MSNTNIEREDTDMKLVSKSEDMRDLFTIVKGQYRKDNSPDDISISGYDPSSQNTNEWYCVHDNVVYYCFYGGSSYEKALQAIKNYIKRYKTRREYFKHVCEVTSEDYYGVHYLNQRPLNDKERSEKACDGRCPRTSPSSVVLYTKVFNNFHHYFAEDIERMEDEAYEELRGKTPLNKTKSLLKKGGLVKPAITEPVPEKKKTLLKKKEVEVPEKTEKKVVFKKPLKLSIR